MEKLLGIMTACAEAGVPVNSFPTIQDRAKRASADDFGACGRLILKKAHEVLFHTGLGHTAPAFHLLFLSKSADWTSHHDEVVNDVVRTTTMLEPMRKVAFNQAAGAGGTLLRGLGYGSLAAGSGLGALTWLLSRHANQDEADTESMQHQVDYYHQLGRDLESSLKRKYNYERKPKADARPATNIVAT